MTTILPSLGYHAMPIDFPSTALVDPSFTPPITTALTQNLPGHSSPSSSHPYSLSPVSSWGDSTPFTMWSKVHSGVPNVMGHKPYYPNTRDREFTDNHSFGYPPNGLNTFSDQIGEQKIYDRRFTCTFNNCGKSFSGEWEKARHIKAMHSPPTIGCRGCNYKQSRKDLFNEHCRKRHPGESIEELMVRLVHNNGVSP